MLLRILGWFWILLGILFLLKPGLIKRRLQKKSMKFLRRYIFLLALVFGFLFISASRQLEGMLSTVVMLLGIIAIFKAFFYLKAKAADKIIAWSSRQPLIFFRVIALLYIALGAFMVASTR